MNFLKGGLAFADFGDHREPDPGAASSAPPAAASACTTSSSRWATGSSASSTASTSGCGTRPPTPRSPPSTRPSKLEGKRRARPRSSARSGCRSGGGPAVRHDRAAGHAEGARPHPGRDRAPRAATRSSSSSGSGEPRYEQRAGRAGLVGAQPDRRAARLHRPARAPADGRRRHLPHALAVRALRPHPDAGAALRRAADRPAASAAWPTRSRTASPASPSTAYTPEAFAGGRASARSTPTPTPRKWQAMVRRGMARDFSWERSVDQYLEVYRRAARPRARCAEGRRWTSSSRCTATCPTC